MAGKQKGMAKGSGTRSGLLWEVERILIECTELPQVLLMENVPQVHSKANMPDFQKWIDFLESKGYSNYWQDLNAKDYGVAQNRDRCFMVSLLGEWNYKFPQPIPLERKLKDYLEDEVDEKCYINNEKAQKLIQTLIKNGTLQSNKGDREIAVKTREMKIAEGNMVGTLTTDSCTSASHNGSYGVVDSFRIRKLTPLECWRLMGFSDEDFQKAEEVNSNSQLYKQAGNSIVKNVLIAIFGQMITRKENLYKEI